MGGRTPQVMWDAGQKRAEAIALAKASLAASEPRAQAPISAWLSARQPRP